MFIPYYIIYIKHDKLTNRCIFLKICQLIVVITLKKDEKYTLKLQKYP